MYILETKAVIKQFSNHLALDNVSISIPENSIFGLLGPNGAGKTTLLRIINNITGPDSGQVLFDGKPLTSNDVRFMGYLPEERGLYRKMKVGEQALYLAQLKGVSKNDAMKKLKFWFEKFEIEAWWNKKVEELSKGMQQKVQFITTVLHNPRLLIFDEPFSGFDPINTLLLKNEILELQKNGATVIFSTHNMASVEEICDTIALINKSKVVLTGKVNDIREQFRTQKVRLIVSADSTVHTAMFGEDFMIESIDKTYSGQELIISMHPSKNLNDLLGIAINSTHIIKVEEIIPGMNDIFIQTVEKN